MIKEFEKKGTCDEHYYLDKVQVFCCKGRLSKIDRKCDGQDLCPINRAATQGSLLKSGEELTPIQTVAKMNR